MTNAELERLAILAEECAEVQHIIMKIIRHGYTSLHPDKPAITNRHLLNKELGDLSFAVGLLAAFDDINMDAINEHMELKGKAIKKYLHYNTL